MGGKNGNAAILNRVKTFKNTISIPSGDSRVKSTLPFDQNELLRGNSAIILPLLIFVVTYPHRLSLVTRIGTGLGIDQGKRKRVRFRIDTAVVAQPKGPVKGWMRDGAPEVDDLEAALEKLGDVGGG